MKSIICHAITDRRVLSVYYDGGSRLIEPFCYGVSTKGNEVLRAYQVEGYSSSGNASGWKLFDVSLISSVDITEKTFNGDRSFYNPNDKAMIKIFCHI